MAGVQRCAFVKIGARAADWHPICLRLPRRIWADYTTLGAGCQLFPRKDTHGICVIWRKYIHGAAYDDSSDHKGPNALIYEQQDLDFPARLC